MREIGIDSEAYSSHDLPSGGVYAYVAVTFFGYDVSGNRGVACGLNNIMKFKDGERLGGRASAESDFGDIDCEDDDDL